MFILTGSSSPEIVKGITESLAGRIATVEMWPFKQTEYYEKALPSLYSRIINSASEIKDFLRLEQGLSLDQCMNVWLKGGFPEPITE